MVGFYCGGILLTTGYLGTTKDGYDTIMFVFAKAD